MPQSLSVSQLATRWSCHGDTIRKRIASGELNAINIASDAHPVYRVRICDVEEFERRKSTRTASQPKPRMRVRKFV